MTQSRFPSDPENGRLPGSPAKRPPAQALQGGRPLLPGRLAGLAVPQDSAGALFVGKGVRLSGEVGNCRRLVVQGELNAGRVKASHLEVREGGRLTGHAEAGRAELDGLFEGDLTVQGLIAVGPRGKAKGSLRYGEIEIARGGRIAGDLEELRGTLPLLRYEKRRITVIENTDYRKADAEALDRPGS